MCPFSADLLIIYGSDTSQEELSLWPEDCKIGADGDRYLSGPANDATLIEPWKPWMR